jgi:antitoxin HicB
MIVPFPLDLIPDIDDGHWFIQIKELRGCVTQVDQWEDVLPMIEDAKRRWLEVALEHSDLIPEPIG